MKSFRFALRVVALGLLLCRFTTAVPAQPALVSAVNSAAFSATAGGDSLSPIISRDGRYVLYSSTADNLITNATGAAYPSIYPAKLNVYLYDRTNSTTTLVSVNTGGTGGGNDDSFAVSISTNGQYVLFESAATNLVTGDTNGANNVFIRDVVNGITTLVSVSTNGGSGNGLSRSSTMTPDGRFVAFVSAATNLVAGDNNGLPDIFVRDMQGGVTTLASVGAMWTNSTSVPTNSSEAPDISDDGRYVAFFSTATNLVPGVATTCEIYVRDLVGGITIQASANSRAIVQPMFNTTNVVSCNHIISADGQYVAYIACPRILNLSLSSGVLIRYHVQSGITDIVNTNAQAYLTGFDVNNRSLDMTRDGNFIAFVTNNLLQTSSTYLPDALWVWSAASDVTMLVSGDTNNTASSVPDYYWPLLSDDGRYVAFFSSVTNLTSDSTVTGWHLYVYDSVATNITLVDPRTNGSAPAYYPPDPPSLSSNGQIIAFESFDPDLVSNDANRAYDVFVRDLSTNIVQLISAASPSLPSLAPNGPSLLSAFSVSTSARYVAFISEAQNLFPNDTNFSRGIFVHDMLTGSNVLASVASNGFSTSGISTDCTISGDGTYVAFTSSSSNLVVGDTNNSRDVFVRNLATGTTTLVSVNTNGNGPGSSSSYSPFISSDGRYVLFRSVATNLAPGFSSTFSENLFRRDMQTGTTLALLTNTSSQSVYAAMTPDGRYVACGIGGSTLYVWDLQASKKIYTNTAAIGLTALSANGQYVAYATSSQVFLADITARTNLLLGSAAVISHPGLQFSSNGQYLAYNSAVSNVAQVFVFNTQAGTSNLISKSYVSAVTGNGKSDSSVISPDGRFIAYRSAASNIVPNDLNGMPDIFLYDQNSGLTTLVTASLDGSFSANNRSFTPVFSPDSQTLLLTSWASDLVQQSFNQSGNVVAFSLYTSNSSPSLTITIIPPATITWPAVEGKSYQVQFKNNLTDPMWQVVNGNVTVIGSEGYVIDLTPLPAQRFYRVMAY